MGSCFSKGKAKGMGEKKSVEGPTVRKDGVPATGVPPSNPISTLKAVEQPKLSTTSSSTSPNLPPPLPSALPVNVAPLENDKRESTLSSPPQSPRQPLSPPPPPPQIETNNSLNEKPVLVASPLPASTPPPMAPTPPPMPPTPPLPRGGMATIAEDPLPSPTGSVFGRNRTASPPRGTFGYTGVNNRSSGSDGIIPFGYTPSSPPISRASSPTFGKAAPLGRPMPPGDGPFGYFPSSAPISGASSPERSTFGYNPTGPPSPPSSIRLNAIDRSTFGYEATSGTRTALDV